MNYQINRTWADSHLEDVKGILKDNSASLVKIEIANDELDTKYSTDMVVSIKGGMIAVRTRRGGYDKYSDLTIRSYKNGGKTELAKIREGFADWYLYMWYDNKDRIKKYILVDLNVLRSQKNFFENNFFREITNTDGTKFIVIPVSYLQSIKALAGHLNLENKDIYSDETSLD